MHRVQPVKFVLTPLDCSPQVQGLMIMGMLSCMSQQCVLAAVCLLSGILTFETFANVCHNVYDNVLFACNALCWLPHTIFSHLGYFVLQDMSIFQFLSQA